MADNNKNSLLSWLSKPESLVGLSAVVISVVAVTVSAYEARIMREWQRAAVWPYVQLGRSMTYTVDEETGEKIWRLKFIAVNVGVGPARIQDIVVTVDGKPYHSWGDAIRALVGDDTSVVYGQSSINGAIMPAEKTIEMFQPADSGLSKTIYDTMNGRLDVHACFCSVFDECWVTNYDSFGSAKPVGNCKRDENSFQE